MGFVSTVSLCTLCTNKELPSTVQTLVFPDLFFTCSGTVTHWSALGDICIGPSANINTLLSIWRERSSELSTYDSVDGIELGICDSEGLASLEPGMIYDYECTLPQGKRLSVQPGDIIGFELPSSFDVKFRPYFDSMRKANMVPLITALITQTY